MSLQIDAGEGSNMFTQELTLIVAATRNMGIGRAGTLPWTGLKKEMAYFARVTKRVEAQSSGTAEPSPIPQMNAVIMGRKTWESIPERFRPLKGRLNIILSRSYPENPWDSKNYADEPVKLPSLASAVTRLAYSADIARAFVIGGAEIYTAALAERLTKRILLTRVLTDFECDTFFPTDLSEESGSEWQKKSKKELDQWVGEQLPDGVQDENGVRYLFEMYERT